MLLLSVKLMRCCAAGANRCLNLRCRAFALDGSDVPESFLSSQSHEPFESESSEILSSLESLLGRVRVESQEWSSHFELLV